MDLTDSYHIAVVVNFFWGAGTVKPHWVNEGVTKVAYKALSEANKCTASLDLVPRPTSGAPGITYIIKQVALIGKRIASGDTRIYDACKKRVAWGYKQAIEMAKLGVY